MALVERWYKFVGMTQATFVERIGAGDWVTFGPIVNGLGVAVDLRKKATIDTSVNSVHEFDGWAAALGWEPTTAPLL